MDWKRYRPPAVLVLGLVGLSLAGCAAANQPNSAGGVAQAPAGTAGPPTTPIDPATVPNCLNEKTRSFGLGVTERKDEASALATFGDVMPWPDPATLPPGAKFYTAYFNAGDQGPFRQSTMGLTYSLGDPITDPRQINIFYMTQVMPFVEPSEPHGTTTLRGGKTAYTFDVPFVEGMHSIQWKEDCRLLSVVADLPAEQVKRIAESLHFPTPGPNNGNWGQQ